jgi:hypothetical protein
MTSSQDAKMLWNQSPEAMIAEWAKSFDYPIPGPSNLVAAISGGTPPAPELSLPQQLEQLASLFPESAFPISSPEDFVRKWQKWGMGNPQGFAGIQSLSNMPQIG